MVPPKVVPCGLVSWRGPFFLVPPRSRKSGLTMRFFDVPSADTRPSGGTNRMQKPPREVTEAFISGSGFLTLEMGQQTAFFRFGMAGRPLVCDGPNVDSFFGLSPLWCVTAQTPTVTLTCFRAPLVCDGSNTTCSLACPPLLWCDGSNTDCVLRLPPAVPWRVTGQTPIGSFGCSPNFGLL